MQLDLFEEERLREYVRRSMLRLERIAKIRQRVEARRAPVLPC